MTAKRAIVGLSVSFFLWLILEAAGIGLSYPWYLAFCVLWIFGPWVWRGAVVDAKRAGITGTGMRIIVGYVLMALLVGGVWGGLVWLFAPWAAVVAGGAGSVLAFMMLCICGTAR